MGAASICFQEATLSGLAFSLLYSVCKRVYMKFTMCLLTILSKLNIDGYG